MVYITQNTVHQYKINNLVSWMEWYILLFCGFHVGDVSFFYIGDSFIRKTSLATYDSDLTQQAQWESCLVNDNLPETYWFKAVWIHLMWLMISFIVSLLSLACIQYKNVLLQSLYISERYLAAHLQICWKSLLLVTFVIL